jgi:hypothetical protein
MREIVFKVVATAWAITAVVACTVTGAADLLDGHGDNGGDGPGTPSAAKNVPDASSVTPEDSTGSNTPTTTTPSTPAAGNGDDAGTPVTPPPKPVDAGGGGNKPDVPTPPPPVDTTPPAFKGAPAFVAGVGSARHKSGQTCLNSCHSHKFTFAGTVVNGAGKGVAGAEVRLVGSDQKSVSVKTLDNGFFYTTDSWKGSAMVGVRTATAVAAMPDPVSTNPSKDACVSCHGSKSPAITLK